MAGLCTGSRTVKDVGPSFRLATVIFPLCCWMISLLMDSPRPRPPLLVE